MKRARAILITGVILFAAGWAIRSTMLMHGYENKPIGGALVAVGFLVIGWGIMRAVRNS